MIKTNYENVGAFETVEPGDYEVVIENAIETYSQTTGKPNINVNFIIRNDINQKFKDQRVWKSIFKVKDMSKANIEGYIEYQIMQICQAIGIPEGTNFNNLSEMLAFWRKKPVKIRLEHREYNGKSFYDVKYVNPTEFKTVNHRWKSHAEQNADFQEVNDDNIPF